MRPQRFDAQKGYSQHFKVFAMCSAGRDVGDLAFEAAELLIHLPVYLRLLAGARAEGRTVRDLTADGIRLPLVDGGLTDWTQKLIANKKERLLISAVGTELLAKIY